MKVLLDECIPRKLKYSLRDHECHTVPEASLAGKKNGNLLDLAEKAGFEIFVTMDRGLEYRQNLAGRSIAIPMLRFTASQIGLPISFHWCRTSWELLGWRERERLKHIAGEEPVR